MLAVIKFIPLNVNSPSVRYVLDSGVLIGNEHSTLTGRDIGGGILGELNCVTYTTCSKMNHPVCCCCCMRDVFYKHICVIPKYI